MICELEESGGYNSIGVIAKERVLKDASLLEKKCDIGLPYRVPHAMRKRTKPYICRCDLCDCTREHVSHFTKTFYIDRVVSNFVALVTQCGVEEFCSWGMFEEYE